MPILEECEAFGIQNGDVCENASDDGAESPHAEFPDGCDPTKPDDDCPDDDIPGTTTIEMPLIVPCPEFYPSSPSSEATPTPPTTPTETTPVPPREDPTHPDYEPPDDTPSNTPIPGLDEPEIDPVLYPWYKPETKPEDKPEEDDPPATPDTDPPTPPPKTPPDKDDDGIPDNWDPDPLDPNIPFPLPDKDNDGVPDKDDPDPDDPDIPIDPAIYPWYQQPDTAPDPVLYPWYKPEDDGPEEEEPPKQKPKPNPPGEDPILPPAVPVGPETGADPDKDPFGDQDNDGVPNIIDTDWIRPPRTPTPPPTPEPPSPTQPIENVPQQPLPDPPPPVPPGREPSPEEKEILQRMNDWRRNKGLPPVEIDDCLQWAAWVHADYKKAMDWFDTSTHATMHEGPEQKGCQTNEDGSENRKRSCIQERLKIMGCLDEFQKVPHAWENGAPWGYGKVVTPQVSDPQWVFDSWVNSDTHRGNMLQPHATKIGFAFAVPPGATKGTAVLIITAPTNTPLLDSNELAKLTGP